VSKGVVAQSSFTEGHSAAEPQPKVVGVGTPWVLVKTEDAKPNRTSATRRSRDFL
jgi:hypothetical protein